MKTIQIAKDFTKFPGTRLKSTGKGSGEEFREKFLLPALEAGEPVTIELDGTVGYPPSFLDEAFGGLLRLGYTLADVDKVFTVKAGPAFEIYARLIQEYLAEEEARRKAG